MSTTLMAEIAGVPPVVLSERSGLQEQVGSEVGVSGWRTWSSRRTSRRSRR